MLRILFLVLLISTHPALAANHCVILQYHHFSESTPAITSVTPAQFDAHLNYLKQNNFNILPLRDVVLSLKQKVEMPDKCVSLTIDDAYRSVYENAYPRLKQLGWPFTVFVSTQAVDQQSNALMNWQQMREMSQHGVSFENHTHSHTHLLRTQTAESEAEWLKRVAMEIDLAQRRITEEIGIAPKLFAYPYGEFTPAVSNLVLAAGLTGFGQQSGPAWPDANMAALPRFPMAANYANMDGFITKVNTLPLALLKAEPIDPMLPVGLDQPTLTLTLAPGKYTRSNLQCFISGSNDVSMIWSENDTVLVTPNKKLKAGRHRSNCTMPSTQKGRFHWYSHNWFIRHPDGSWYPEY